MDLFPGHYQSIYFLFGLFVVMVYAWQKFNEPTFPRGETMPSTVDPLRHMFTQGAYKNARLTYVCVSLLLYSALVWPGPSMMRLLGTGGTPDLPAEAWALLVALFLVGLVPNSRIKWVIMVEEFLRRSVHSWYLVPARVEGMIGSLEDARYEPPERVLRAVSGPFRERLEALRSDLKAPPASLEHRWARATFIFNMLKQIGVAAELPLKAAAFHPFSDDFRGIQEKYSLVQKDVAALHTQPQTDQVEEDLKTVINGLLKRMYAYISWGLGNQEKNEREIDEVLRDIGFKIPVRSPYRPIDILGPAIALVALITMVFWLVLESFRGGSMETSIKIATQAAVSAFCMYGAAVYIALNSRSTLIRNRDWSEGSPRCFLTIAFKAGIATWLTIALFTAVFTPENTWNSLSGLARWVGSLATDSALTMDRETVLYLPKRVGTASPWFFVGAVASVLIFIRFRGDVRTGDTQKRLIDAAVVAIGLGATVYLAQMIQGAWDKIPGIGTVSLKVGLAGLACGAVLGYFVPHAFRMSVSRPYDRNASAALDDLVGKAEKALGAQSDAEDWVFTPHKKLGGITPAEALQHKSLATGVSTLLDFAAPPETEAQPPAIITRPTPMIIEGGRS
ncbi:hypothetical protein [Phyllobacterium brassicacearum]|nr:hypothetical protein [Phyllobacterium brassicacearum]TDQ15307.1 hypothetical protein DEV91_13420 [Phyllobacterium brassicacearum]